MAETAKKQHKKSSATPKKKGKSDSAKIDEEVVTTREVISFIYIFAIALTAVTAFVMLVSYTSCLFRGSAWEQENMLGTLGIWVARSTFDSTFGLGSYMVPIFLLATVARLSHLGRIRLWKWFINCAMLMVWISVFAAFIQQFDTFKGPIALGGTHGITVFNRLKEGVGSWGTGFIIFVSAALYVLYASGETVRMLRKAVAADRRRRERLEEQEATTRQASGTEETGEAAEQAEESHEQAEESLEQCPLPAEIVNTATTIEFEHNDENQTETASEEPDIEMEIAVGDRVIGENDVEEGEKLTIGDKEPEAELDETGALEPYDPKLDLENYRYPTLDLLKHYAIDSSHVDMEEQRQNKDKIIKVLGSFGVGISSIKATVGPTVTLYEITPAEGVRISKIRNLEDDIALSLSALGIRIIAPIPGKGTVGIEVPNAHPQMVSMESVINSRKFQECTMELPMALGKTITNEIFMADLAKMPHLLVAGATGQGKSVGLNAIITSLLYKKHPAELKLVMVDPKKVEFSVYNPIVNHFLAQVEGNQDTEEPIITDVNKVIQTLKSLCLEMDTRYDLLKAARVRNVKEYNAKFKERHLNPEKGHRFMPYIVVVIDEFGDLIMTAGKEIEQPIARIAQLARAVGIHMIIATQRPTTNIITGTIKANFPARMAFKVSAMVDSRTILDRPGANQLVGKGDMLFQAGGEDVRVQCAFVDTPEVENIASFIACQQSYSAPFPLPHVEMEGDEGCSTDVDMGNLDPMFEEVARLVVNTQQGSTSMIQRKFSIGYNRAGRLMDQLEAAGIVGPAHGSKPREVLCMGDIELDILLSNMR